jgi:hypothetical protein
MNDLGEDLTDKSNRMIDSLLDGLSLCSSAAQQVQQCRTLQIPSSFGYVFSFVKWCFNWTYSHMLSLSQNVIIIPSITRSRVLFL